MIEAVTVTEPEWSEEDRAWAAALIDLEWVTCPGCGGDLTQTTSPDPDQGFRVEDTVCEKCKAISTARDAYHAKHQDKHGQSDVHTHMWTAKPIRRGDPRGG